MGKNKRVRQLDYSKVHQLCFWFSGSDTAKGHAIRYFMLRDRMSYKEASQRKRLWTLYPNHGGLGWDVYGQKYAAEALVTGMTRSTFDDYLTKKHKIQDMYDWVGFEIPEVLDKGVEWMARQLRLDDERKRKRYDFKSAIMSVGIGRALYKVIAPASYRRYMEAHDASEDRLYCTEAQKNLLEVCGYNDIGVQEKIMDMIGAHTFICLPTHANPLNMSEFMAANAQFTEIRNFYVGVR